MIDAFIWQWTNQKKKFASGQQYGTSQTIISTKYTFAGLEKS
jgi:hypothetical protein